MGIGGAVTMGDELDLLIDKYLKERYGFNVSRFSELEKLRIDFINTYSISKIKSLSINEYTPVTQASHTFCSRLRWDLQQLGTMGNAYPDVFGIYEKDYQIRLSKTYSNLYGNDYDGAFNRIKEDIVEVLEAADSDDFEAIEKSKLNSLFKNKLLMVYYPDKVIPVCVKNTLDAYCEAVGYVLPENMSFIFKNLALKDYKDQSETFSEWSNFQFMGFCDWIWRQNKKVTLKKAMPQQDAEKAIKLEQEIEELHLTGENKEAVVKVRVNQGVFRDRLLERYHKCCLCNVNLNGLLVASHIKPWAASTPEERLDINNGFIFCPTHDKLFDKGYISFDDEGKIIISNEMDLINQTFCNVNSDMSIEINAKQKVYLEYHRNMFGY